MNIQHYLNCCKCVFEVQDLTIMQLYFFQRYLFQGQHQLLLEGQSDPSDILVVASATPKIGTFKNIKLILKSYYDFSCFLLLSASVALVTVEGMTSRSRQVKCTSNFNNFLFSVVDFTRAQPVSCIQGKASCTQIQRAITFYNGTSDFTCQEGNKNLAINSGIATCGTHHEFGAACAMSCIQGGE